MSSQVGSTFFDHATSAIPSSERALGEPSGQLELKLFPEIHTVSIAGDKEHELHYELHDGSGSAPELLGADAAAPQSVGDRLRAAREARGWTREDVSSRLKLQSGLVRRIEEDDYNGIAHAVYLRGYLTSYARLLGLPLSIADEVVATRAEETPLVSTGTISRSRYLLDRYSVSATYLILTGLVIGPAVWLATHGGLRQDLARTVLLDAPSTQVIVPDGRAGAYPESVVEREPNSAISVPPPVVSVDAPPVIASMAPFSAMQSPAVQSPAVVQPVPGKAHTLTLKLEQASWVEVTAIGGEKLEYSLLAAGTQRTYASDDEITIRIGNAEGAEIVADGKPVDLAPFRRANVARLKMFGSAEGARQVDF